MSKRLIGTLFVAVLAATSVLGGARSASAAIFTTADALAQGELFAHDPMFQSVGWIGRAQGDSGFGFGGSGVLIDPYWILTAGHILTFADDSGIDAAIFGLSNSLFDDLTHVAADAWFVFPGYTGSATPGTNVDLGLIRLADPIFDVVPAQRFYGVDEPGTHMYMAGYGRPGVWPDFADQTDGIMRAGENIGENLGRPTIGVEEQYWVSKFSLSNPLPLEWQSSPGDSGGGWFADLDGHMQLVGINGFSRGNSDFSGAIRTSLFNDWIDSTMAANPPPAVVPEPSSFVLFTLAFLLLGCSQNVWQKQTDTT